MQIHFLLINAFRARFATWKTADNMANYSILTSKQYESNSKANVTAKRAKAVETIKNMKDTRQMIGKLTLAASAPTEEKALRARFNNGLANLFTSNKYANLLPYDKETAKKIASLLEYEEISWSCPNGKPQIDRIATVLDKAVRYLFESREISRKGMTRAMAAAKLAQIL